MKLLLRNGPVTVDGFCEFMKMIRVNYGYLEVFALSPDYEVVTGSILGCGM